MMNVSLRFTTRGKTTAENLSEDSSELPADVLKSAHRDVVIKHVSRQPHTQQRWVCVALESVLYESENTLNWVIVLQEGEPW